MSDSKVKVTLRRSVIGRPGKQKRTVIALGLGRVGSTKTHTVTPQIRGMINQVSHLVDVEEA